MGKAADMIMKEIAIIGAGNLGSAIARGLVRFGGVEPGGIVLTRRTAAALDDLRAEGFGATVDNIEAVRDAAVVLITVRPKQMNRVLIELRDVLDPARQVVVSTVSDVRITDIRKLLVSDVPLLRAMPNVGVAAGASMTCLCCEPSTPDGAREHAESVFRVLGHVEYVEESQMTPATALCACGIAFFLRAIRAASQGGVQVGFHADEAIRLAAQTAKGAAELVLAQGQHPESLIDTVTTPLGITIAGLNEMEHQGFSSALIRGIVVSAEKANRLYLEREPLNEEA